jgi:hypothetical protein
VAGVGYILLHQLDVRAAVTLWPKVANNDAYFFARMAWMIGSLAIFMWSLTASNSAVAKSPTCPLRASECNESKLAFVQHFIVLAIILVHPLAYGLIQLVQYKQCRPEYEPADERTPGQLTAFEGYGCGGPLGDYYYYNTLVAQAARADGTVRRTGTSPWR